MHCSTLLMTILLRFADNAQGKLILHDEYGMKKIYVPRDVKPKEFFYQLLFEDQGSESYSFKMDDLETFYYQHSVEEDENSRRYFIEIAFAKEVQEEIRIPFTVTGWRRRDIHSFSGSVLRSRLNTPKKRIFLDSTDEIFFIPDFYHKDELIDSKSVAFNPAFKEVTFEFIHYEMVEKQIYFKEENNETFSTIYLYSNVESLAELPDIISISIANFAVTPNIDTRNYMVWNLSVIPEDIEYEFTLNGSDDNETIFYDRQTVKVGAVLGVLIAIPSKENETAVFELNSNYIEINELGEIKVVLMEVISLPNATFPIQVWLKNRPNMKRTTKYIYLKGIYRDYEESDNSSDFSIEIPEGCTELTTNVLPIETTEPTFGVIDSAKSENDETPMTEFPKNITEIVGNIETTVAPNESPDFSNELDLSDDSYIDTESSESSEQNVGVIPIARGQTIFPLQGETYVFESRMYHGSIQENSPVGSKVIFLEKKVSLHRSDSNIYVMSLKTHQDVFDIVPNVLENNYSVNIISRDPLKLDYESTKSFELEMQARLVLTNYVVDTAKVVIYILDVNDNPPRFQQNHYLVNIPENFYTETASILSVKALDADSGTLGAVRYTAIIGPGAETLRMDSSTGEIFVIAPTFDRETAITHLYLVEARDNEGTGLRSEAQLIVTVEDVNDNAPVFNQEKYQFLIASDQISFEFPAKVTATDADAEVPNNIVKYSIMPAVDSVSFAIDPDTGVLSFNPPTVKPTTDKMYSLSVIAKDQAEENPLNVSVLVEVFQYVRQNTGSGGNYSVVNDSGGHDSGGHDSGGHDSGGHDNGGHDSGGNDIGGQTEYGWQPDNFWIPDAGQTPMQIEEHITTLTGRRVRLREYSRENGEIYAKVDTKWTGVKVRLNTIDIFFRSWYPDHYIEDTRSVAHLCVVASWMWWWTLFICVRYVSLAPLGYS